MRPRFVQAPLLVPLARRTSRPAKIAIAFFAMVLSFAETASALLPGTGEDDANNTYKNVGAYMFADGGAVNAYGSGVLIHERLFLTAAHLTGWHVRGVAPFLRMVVSFSHDDPRETSTWIDTTAHLVHPTYPYQNCAIIGRFDPGSCPPLVSDFELARSPLHDIGLVVLARPVTNAVPATLPAVGDLEGAVGVSMTIVGYGCEPRLMRNFGTGSMAELSERVAWYNHDRAQQCFGDSGGPTFYRDRVVSLVSGGDGRSFRFRVDHPSVLNWIAGVVESLNDVVDAIEFYNAALDHYFLTWVPGEIAILDAGVTIRGWTRTGQRIRVYSVAKPGASPVCRFYLPPAYGGSHFYGRGVEECEATARNYPGFELEDPQFMHMVLPVAGNCPENTTTTKKVFRVFRNRADANHRYMIDPNIRDQMVSRGWLAEGEGPDLVTMCGPQ